jgi:Domain of unknown function (DUF1996)
MAVRWWTAPAAALLTGAALVSAPGGAKADPVDGSTIDCTRPRPGAVTCVGDDGSSYWTTPALVDGTARTPTSVSVSVLPSPSVSASASASASNHAAGAAPETSFPPGFQLVLTGPAAPGDASANAAFRWTCSGDTSATTPGGSCPDDVPHLLIRWPNCWDGRSADGQGTGHVIYPTGAGTCPSGFPIVLPVLRTDITYGGPAAGDVKPGEPNPEDPALGGPTPGEPSPGEPSPGDQASGDATPGDESPGETTPGEPASGEPGPVPDVLRAGFVSAPTPTPGGPARVTVPTRPSRPAQPAPPTRPAPPTQPAPQTPPTRPAAPTPSAPSPSAPAVSPAPAFGSTPTTAATSTAPPGPAAVPAPGPTRDLAAEVASVTRVRVAGPEPADPTGDVSGDGPTGIDASDAYSSGPDATGLDSTGIDSTGIEAGPGEAADAAPAEPGQAVGYGPDHLAPASYAAPGGRSAWVWATVLALGLTVFRRRPRSGEGRDHGIWARAWAQAWGRAAPRR